MSNDRSSQDEDTPFDKALLLAMENTDRVFNRFVPYLREKEEAYDSLFDRVDYMPAGMDFNTLENRFKNSMMRLRDAVSGAGNNAGALADAFDAYVALELERLFFVTNDGLSAHMAHDAMRDTVEDVLPEWRAIGLVGAADEARMRASVRAFDEGMEAYEELKDFRANVLGEQGLDSLIDWVGKRSADHVWDPAAAEACEADTFISQQCRDTFQEALRYNGLEVEAGSVDVRLFLVGALVSAVAGQLLQRVQGVEALDEPQLNAMYIRIRGELIEQLFEAHKDAPAHDRIGAMIANMREEYRALTGEPNHPYRLVRDALQAAQAGLPDMYHAPAPVVKPTESQWLREMYGLGTPARATQHLRTVMRSLDGQLEHATSVSTAAALLRQHVYEVAVESIVGDIEPAVLRAYAGAVEAVGRSLSGQFDRAHPSMQYARKALDEAKQLSKTLVENQTIAKDWLYYDTAKCWDSYFLQGRQQQAAYNGKSHDKFDASDTAAGDALAKELFRGSCLVRLGTTARSPLMVNGFLPLMYEKACQIAEMREPVAKPVEGFADWAERRDKMQQLRDQRERGRDERVRKGAVTILESALQYLPVTRMEDGTTKPSGFGSGEAVVRVLQLLDAQLQALEAKQGRGLN